MPHLFGKRVMLREYRRDDFDHIRRWMNDRETVRFMSTRFWPPQTSIDAEEYLQRMMQSSHNAYNFVIADAEDESYIGQLDMFRVDWRLRQGEIGMVIGRREHRGKGYALEALQLLQDYVFSALGLERLELEVHMDNVPAIRCYELAGFTLEGVKRHAFYSDGRFGDVGVMSILRQDWEKARENHTP